MSAPNAYGRELHRLRQRQYARRRRVALALVLATVTAATLLLSAFGGGGRPASQLAAAPASARLLPAGPPTVEAVAHLGTLAIEFPVNQSRTTAIGYYDSPDGALTLDPIGTQANAGLLSRLWHWIAGGGSGSLRWYMLGGSTTTSALEVGAPAGADVYAPVDGTIVGINQVVLNGAPHGDDIEIQPSNAPSLVVSVSTIAPDPSLVVGATVNADATKLGEVLNLAPYESQALAHYTTDAGNHVLIEVHPAATLALR